MQEDVLGLYVAMDDALAVCEVERAGDVSDNPNRLVDCQHLLSRKTVAQRFTLHERHDIEQRAGCVSRIVQRQDVRVLQVGGDLDFLEEAFCAERRSQLGLEHLERDLPVVPQVNSEVDRSHAALAELSLDVVAVGQHSLQLFKVRGRIGHVDLIGLGAQTICG